MTTQKLLATARTEPEIIDAVPSILGFQPTDSVVVLVLERGLGVRFTARLDLGDVLCLDDPVKPFAAAFERMRLGGSRRPALGAVVVAYGVDADVCRRAAEHMFAHLPTSRLFGAVVVGAGWWFLDDGPYDPARPYAPRVSAIGLATAAGGRAVYETRGDLDASLDPVGGRLPRGITRAVRDAQQRVAELGDGQLFDAMRAMLDEHRGPVDPHEPSYRSVDDLAFLAALAKRPAAREAYWQVLERDTADDLVEIWRDVVRVTPRRHRVASLCLLGMAAWQAGEGALLSMCLDRAGDIAPGHELVKVLSAVCLNLLPPDLWHQMRGYGEEAA